MRRIDASHCPLHTRHLVQPLQAVAIGQPYKWRDVESPFRGLAAARLAPGVERATTLEDTFSMHVSPFILTPPT